MTTQVIIEDNVAEVEVIDESVEVNINTDDVRVVEVETPGLQGPPGPQGQAGAFFEFVQSVASTTWTVNHNLGFRPDVEILNSGGRKMSAEVLHTSINQVICYFNVATTGCVRCS